jgi:hypothetical protein
MPKKLIDFELKGVFVTSLGSEALLERKSG